MNAIGQPPAHEPPAGRCGAKNRQGNPCGKPAGWGTDHVGIGRCRLHLGTTPDHRRAAMRVKALQEAHQFGVPIETTPVAALLGELARSAGIVAWLEAKLRWSTPGDGLVVDAAKLEAGPCEDDEGDGENGVVAASGPSVLVREHIPREWGTEIRVAENPLLKVWRDERKHLAEVASACHRAGVEDAIVRLEEAKAELTVMAIVAALELPGVAPTPELKLAALGRAQEVLAHEGS